MPRSRIPPILPVSLVLLSGCAGFAKATAPALEGAPAATGIVVVEPDITFYANTIGTPYGERLIGGAIVRADDAKQIVSGRPTSGLVVFSNLPPGRWRLSLIEGQLPQGIMLRPEDTFWRRHYEFSPESADAFTFEVRAGEAVYAGVGIVDDDRADSRGVRFKRLHDPAAEARAWTWMQELYQQSAWAPVFRSKLETSSAPAAASR